jgi:hypothetical protein
MSDFLEKLSSFSNSIIPTDAIGGPHKIENPFPGIEVAPLKVAAPAPAPVAPVPNPADKLAQDMKQLDAALSNPTAMAMFNLSRERDNTLTRDNQIIQDRKSLSAPEFIQKYGDDTYQKMSAIDMGQAHLKELGSGSRTAGEWAKDNVINVGSGAAQGLGGIAAFGLSMVNDKAAVATSEFMRSVKDATEAQQSQTLNRRRFVDSLRGQLDKQDGQKQFEADKASEGEIVASLRSIGRGVISGTNRLYEDPMILETGVAEAGGSLFVGGPVAKGLTRGAQVVAGRTISNVPGALAGVGASAAEKALEQAAFPLTVGAMEAGGAYSDTVNEVMQLSDESLKQTSTAYKALRDNGTPEREAKIEVASRAGDVAKAITFPVAALSGKLVEGIEKAPLQTLLGKSPGHAAGNIAKEFLEEGIQSGTGQFSGNVGQKIYVDPSQNLGEGVGDQAIQGAIMGAGSAGVMLAPGAAAKGIGAAGKSLLGGVSNAVGDRADKIRAANESSSPVSVETLTPEVTQAMQDAPVVAEAVRSAANDPGIPEAQKPAVQAVANQVETIFNVTPEELAKVSPAVRETASQAFPDQAASRFDLMLAAGAVAVDSNRSQEDRTDAALWLLSQRAEHQDFIRNGKDLLGQLDHARPEVVSFDRYASVLEKMAAMPQMAETLKWVDQELAAPKVEAGQDLSSPEGQRVVQTTADIAQLVPEKIDVSSADVILRQDREKPFLAPEQRQDIHAALSLAQAAELHAAIMGANDGTNDGAKEPSSEDRIAIVNRQIDVAGGKAAHQKSLAQHVLDINFALRTNQTEAAKRRIQHLAMFARSMRNKLDAMNQAIQNGDRKDVAYQALGPNNKWLPKDGTQRVFYNPGAAKSEQLARQIHADASAAALLANSFAKEYPEYGIKEISVPNLVSASDIIKDNSSNNPDTTVSPKLVEKPAVAQAKTGRGSSELASKAPAQSQATTSEIDPNPSQIELPLSLPEPAPKPIAPETVRDAAQAGGRDNQAQNAVPVNSGEGPGPAARETARPEAVTTGVDTGSGRNANADTTQKTEDAFPNLVRSQGENWFHKAFRFTKDQTSRMFEDASPLRAMFERMSNVSEIVSRAKVAPDQTQLQAFEDLLKLVDKAYDKMDERLAGVPDLLELLKKGDQPVLRFVRGKVLNIVEPKGDGFAYNSQLRESALLAGLDWLLNAPAMQSTIDREDLSASLGLPGVTGEMVEFFNRGVSVDHAKQQLAKKIVQFWGLQTNQNVDMVYATGLAEAVAIEVIASFKDVGLLAHENSSRFQEMTGKTYGRIYFDMRSDSTNEIFKNIGGARALLSKLALINPVPEGASVGAPVRQVATTQLRNSAVKTTRQQRQALEREQKVRYLPNRLVFDMVESLGEDAFVLLMSSRENADDLNVNHARSVDGQIRGLRMAFQNVVAQMREVEAHAELTGSAVEDVPTFYPHEITRVGRLQMMGAANPQSDKLAREIFMPTRSVLNLNNPAHQDFFWLTVAQGLGVKTEKDTRSAAREKAEGLVQGQYSDVIRELAHWVRARDEGSIKSLPKELVEQIRRAAGGSISMHGMHSLLSVAQLQVAQEAGRDLSSFTHFNYLEADGKTNGPINALMLLARGEFSPAWIKAVAKGGVFFGSQNQGRTLNTMAKEPDLYGEGANTHKARMAELRESLKNNTPVLEQMNSLLRLLGSLNADVSFDQDAGTVTIGRGVAKNPLTISIYGSGVDGIAGKVAGELVELIYAKMSDFIGAKKADANATFEQSTYDQFWNDLQALTDQRAAFDKEEQAYVLKPGFQAKREASQKEIEQVRTPGGFTLFPHQFDTLKGNVRSLFVDPLAQAINQTVMGHVGETTDAIQQATQIQSIVMRALYRRTIIEKLAEKQSDPNFREGDFLSERELQDIVKDLLPMGPAFSTGTQSYFLGGSEQTDVLGNRDQSGKQKPILLKRGDRELKIRIPEYFSRGLENDFSSAPLIYGPTLAGVKSVPSLVIGSGDGQMMLNAATNEKINRTLKVFDGMNMPADKIEEYSREINGSVHQTWLNNPVNAVAKSFRDFLNNSPFDLVLDPNDEINAQTQLMQDVALEMAKVLTGNPNPKEPATRDEIELAIANLGAKLEEISGEIDARQAVFKTLPMTVDQMASGESPYVLEGSIGLEAQSDDAVLSVMNREYQNQLIGQIEGQARTQTPDEAPAQIDAQVRVIEAKALTADLGSLGSLNESQQEVMTSALETLKASGYQAVIGTRAQVDTWLQQNNADRYQPGMLDTANGFVDPVSKILVAVTDGSSDFGETALHEMIHAATFQKVLAYYTDPKSISDVEQIAVENIEALMNQWLLEDYSGESELTQTAQSLAVNAIRGHLNNNNRAAAVNEFMAWVLSNQQLSAVAEKTWITQSIFQIVGDTLKAIKDLIWGKGKSKLSVPKAGDNVLEQLRFNTRILMDMPSAAQLLAQDSGAVALYQSAAFGTSDRLSDLRQRFHDKITAWVAADPTLAFTRTSQIKHKAYIDAAQVAKGFLNQGFLPTMQEVSTFNEIVAALSVDVELNPVSLSRIQDLYEHVIDKIAVEDFMTGLGDPNADRYQAQNKFDALHGLFGASTDAMGRSSLMPAFLGLAMVDDSFRKILSGVALPKSEKSADPRTFDQKLEDLGLAGMDRLSLAMSGEGKSNASVQEALDRLTQALLENTGDTRSFIEQSGENGIAGVENYLSNQIQNLSDKIGDKADNIIKNNGSAIVRGGARLVRAVATLVNQERSDEAAMGITHWLNQLGGAHAMRELVNDIVGRTRENASVFDMITKVRSAVQQNRQQFREHLPQTIAKQFTRKLSGNEWTALYRGLGKTDLASLHSTYGVDGSLSFLTDAKKLGAEIKLLEGQILASEPRRFAVLQQKAAQLANYMLTGEHGSSLLRNAYAVARLMGQRGYESSTVENGLVDQIDRLVTLYAVQGLEQGTKDAISALMTDQQQGMGFSLSYLRGLRNTEIANGQSSIAQANGYKGHIPTEGQQGVSLIVASDSEHARLLALGYTNLGPYVGSSADRNLGRRSYFFAPVSGRAAYNQGVMQNVHQTVNGVDPNTGYTVGELTAGRITDPQIVALVNRQLANQRQTSENLLPVFGANGNVVAYERSIDPAQLTRINRDTNLSRSLGVWAGRQVEEALAGEFNKGLVDNLHQLWIEGRKAGRRDEFVNLANLRKTDDPVLHEAWRLIPQHTREMIQDRFGNDGFQVRRDMLNDAVGYRSASVGDLFTGNSRWKPGVQKTFQDIAFSMFGNKAYSRLISGEKAIQDLVSNAKVLIVVKSVIVPAANMMANIFQLLNRGVPIRHIVKGLGSKTIELNDFIKRRHAEIDLEAELQAAKGVNDLAQIRKLESRIRTIKDSYKRLSIWPLIEAGEFSAISNGVVTAEDLALADGKWGEWAERFSTRVPEQFRTAWRYGFVTRDTALFQGLGKAVQYGDFLGKAIMYDDLVQRKKVSQEDAIAQVNEAFVNYNRLSGRSRQYLESVGLLWFYNFKLRSIKEGAYMLRHHPLKSLLLMAMPPAVPGLGDIGSPTTDNFLALLADGKLGYSVGPSMGLHSFSLNPWVNLVK